MANWHIPCFAWPADELSSEVNFMSSNLENEKKHEAETEQLETEPRKIVLGKRVVRQFVVKSGVQTGMGRCSRSDPGPP